MTYLQNPAAMLQSLENIAGRLGVKIRYERLGDEGDSSPIRSGLCRLRNHRYLLVDSRLPASQQFQVLAAELRRFDLSGVFMPPALRELLENPEDDT